MRKGAQIGSPLQNTEANIMPITDQIEYNVKFNAVNIHRGTQF